MGVPGSNKHKVQVNFSLENSAFLRGMREVNTSIKKAKRNAEDNYGALANSLERMNRGILITLGAITGAIAAIGGMAIKTAGEFELLQVQFETLSGSAEKADKLIREMKEFAAKTPLKVTDIQQAAVMMLGFGYSIDEIIPKLKLFGEAAITMRVPMEQIIRVREFLLSGQFRSIMLAPLGISRAEMETAGAAFGPRGDLISSAEDAVAAFDKILSERFGGLFDKVQGIVIQRMINIGDQIALIFDQIGRAIRPIAVEILEWLESTFNRFRTWLENNSKYVEEAGRVIANTFMVVFKPFMDGITRFLDKLEEDPGLIVEVANNIMMLVNALTGLLILSSIVVVIIRFVTMIGMLNMALGTMGTSIVGLLPLLGPWAIAIAAVVGGFILLNNHMNSVTAANEKEIRVVTEHLEVLKKQKELISEVDKTLISLEGSTQKSADKFRELRNKIQEIIDINPKFIHELGLIETTSGQLVDTTGKVYDNFEDLLRLWNDDFDSSKAVIEINKVSTALTNMRYQEFMRPKGFGDAFRLFFTSSEYLEKEKQKEWDKMRTEELTGEMPDLLGRFFEQPTAKPGEAGGGVGGGIEDEIEIAEDPRSKRWTTIIDDLMTAAMERNIAIEHGLKTREEAEREYNDAIRRAVEGMLLLDAEQNLRLDHEAFMNYLLDNEVIPTLMKLATELDPWNKLLEKINEAEKERLVAERMAAAGLTDINIVNENYRNSIIDIIEEMIRLDETVGLTADQMGYLANLIEKITQPTALDIIHGRMQRGGYVGGLGGPGFGSYGLDMPFGPQVEEESPWDKISKKWKEFWSTFTINFASEIEAVEGSLLKGFRNLGRAIVSGDIGQAMASLFNDLGNTIGALVEQMISTSIGGLGGGLLGALGGGIIGGVISMIGSLFTEKAPGVSMSQPSYVYITNWDGFWQFGATMPVSYVMSGRSEHYGTDPHGRVLDYTVTGYENGEHFDE